MESQFKNKKHKKLNSLSLTANENRNSLTHTGTSFSTSSREILWIFFGNSTISALAQIKDTLKAFIDFKYKPKSAQCNIFCYVKYIYILKVYLVHYTLR